MHSLSVVDLTMIERFNTGLGLDVRVGLGVGIHLEHAHRLRSSPSRSHPGSQPDQQTQQTMNTMDIVRVALDRDKLKYFAGDVLTDNEKAEALKTKTRSKSGPEIGSLAHSHAHGTMYSNSSIAQHSTNFIAIWNEQCKLITAKPSLRRRSLDNPHTTARISSTRQYHHRARLLLRPNSVPFSRATSDYNRSPKTLANEPVDLSSIFPGYGKATASTSTER